MYNSGMFKSFLLVVTAAVAVAGCTSRDVTKDLQVVEVASGWYDLGVVADGPEKGKNKLVPSVSLKLKNVSQKAISGVQLDAVFTSLGEAEKVIDEHFAVGIDSRASLEPGATTPPIVLRAKWGFVGEETRSLMLQNSRFTDARVKILGRHGRRNWASMAVVPVERKLLGRGSYFP